MRKTNSYSLVKVRTVLFPVRPASMNFANALDDLSRERSHGFNNCGAQSKERDILRCLVPVNCFMGILIMLLSSSLEIVATDKSHVERQKKVRREGSFPAARAETDLGIGITAESDTSVSCLSPRVIVSMGLGFLEVFSRRCELRGSVRSQRFQACTSRRAAGNVG